MFVALTGTTGMLSGGAAATGEGIGWRGFVVPELAKVARFTGVVALLDHRGRVPRCRPSDVHLANRGELPAKQAVPQPVQPWPCG
jgi:hypothetical protein